MVHPPYGLALNDVAVDPAPPSMMVRDRPFLGGLLLARCTQDVLGGSILT